MTNLIEVKTAELTGAALDWAVAQVADVPFFQMGESWPGNSAVNEAARLGPVVIMDLMGKLRFEAGSCFVAWLPSADWSQGGALIATHRVSVVYSDEVCDPCAWTDSTAPWHGDTPLIAACRAIVASKLGDTVQIPAELLP